MKSTQALRHSDSSIITVGRIRAKAGAFRTVLSWMGVMILAGCGAISHEAPRSTAMAPSDQSDSVMPKMPGPASSGVLMRDAAPRISLRSSTKKRGG